MSDADEPYRNLRRFNAAMAVLHFVQGALMVYLSTIAPGRSPKRTSSSSRRPRRWSR